MTEPQAIAVVSILGFLVLVITGVRRRRMPRDRLIGMSLIWVAIFLGLFLIAYWIDGQS